ncbi:glycosyltransferase family 2 protein [Sphingobacterium sp. WOUb80]|uniref:glycosyltransferase family 2 protein n=1 Tax=Sphingobacterium sp. WOUb80 TaxID=3234028 RepID=UPI003CFBB180
MQPISIIIPTYNNENTIVDKIESVKKQTSQSWSCIIVDDHSTDRTVRKIKSMIANDGRFQLIESSSNRDANFCKNIGLKSSKGDFLIFLNGDDMLYPTCIEARITFIKKLLDLDMLISQTTYFEHDINNIIDVLNRQIKVIPKEIRKRD